MTTAHAIRIHSFGGPEVLQEDEIEVRAPGDGEMLVRVMAAGVGQKYPPATARPATTRAVISGTRRKEPVLPIVPTASLRTTAGPTYRC